MVTKQESFVSVLLSIYKLQKSWDERDRNNSVRVEDFCEARSKLFDKAMELFEKKPLYAVRPRIVDDNWLQKLRERDRRWANAFFSVYQSPSVWDAVHAEDS